MKRSRVGKVEGVGILKADDDDSRFLHGNVQDNDWLRE